MTKAVYLIGSGGHASSVLDAFKSQGGEIDALVSPDIQPARSIFSKYPVMVDDAFIKSVVPEDALLINGIGPSVKNNVRNNVEARYKKLGFTFVSVISKAANVSEFVVMGDGIQILAGATIQSGVHLDSGTVVNTGAVIDHDCIIGQNCHIAPGVTLCGQVHVDNGVYIGAGATVIENIKLGSAAFVAAGAVITEDVCSNARAYGFKAKIKGA